MPCLFFVLISSCYWISDFFFFKWQEEVGPYNTNYNINEEIHLKTEYIHIVLFYIDFCLPTVDIRVLTLELMMSSGDSFWQWIRNRLTQFCVKYCVRLLFYLRVKGFTAVKVKSPGLLSKCHDSLSVFSVYKAPEIVSRCHYCQYCLISLLFSFKSTVCDSCIKK